MSFTPAIELTTSSCIPAWFGGGRFLEEGRGESERGVEASNRAVSVLR